MANSEQNRVTKDISARKNPAATAMQATSELRRATEGLIKVAIANSPIEQACQQIGNYVSEVRADYNAEMQKMADEHAEEKSKLMQERQIEMAGKQEEFVKERQTLLERLRTAKAQGAEAAHEEAEVKISGLNDEIIRSISVEKDLEKSIKDWEAKNFALKDEMEKRSQEHDMIVKKLQRQIDNSHIEVEFHFDGKDKIRKPFKRLFKPIEKLEDIGKVLRKEKNLGNTSLLFRLQGRPLDERKTLKELDVRPGAIIHYAEK